MFRRKRFCQRRGFEHGLALVRWFLKFRFGFGDDLLGASFTVFASTNVAWPLKLGQISVRGEIPRQKGRVRIAGFSPDRTCVEDEEPATAKQASQSGQKAVTRAVIQSYSIGYHDELNNVSAGAGTYRDGELQLIVFACWLVRAAPLSAVCSWFRFL